MVVVAGPQAYRPRPSCSGGLQKSSRSRCAAVDRRHALLVAPVALFLATRPAFAVEVSDATPFAELESRAKRAYAERRLEDALAALTELVQREPSEPVWRERRAQVYLDLKRFQDSLDEFEAAVKLQPANFVSLGLLGNRALAHEGLSQWDEAAADVRYDEHTSHLSLSSFFSSHFSSCQYEQSLALAESLGFSQPYVQNALANVRAYQGDFDAALAGYKAAAETFRSASPRNLAGSIYAESNAALMEVQLGRPSALRSLEAVARKAPGSIDTRAALAGLRHAAGDTAGAERDWNWACTRINSGQLVDGGSVYDGCSSYRDDGWVRAVRRWPPAAADMLADFLALRPPRRPVDRASLT